MGKIATNYHLTELSAANWEEYDYTFGGRGTYARVRRQNSERQPMDGYYGWVRLLTLFIGAAIGWTTITLAKKKWQEVIGIITLLCSIVISIAVEVWIWGFRINTMNDNDWQIIWSSLNFIDFDTLVALSYLLLPVLWMICLSQIIRIVLASRKLRS